MPPWSRKGTLASAGFAGEVAVRRAADMRYGEQVFEITVPFDDIDWSGPGVPEAIAAAFHARHRALYTYALEDQEAVLVNARLSVIGRLAPTAQDVATPVTEPALVGRRRLWLDGWTEVSVYDFSRLTDGQTLAGPAIVASETTTVLLRNGDKARFDARGWLDIGVKLG